MLEKLFAYALLLNMKLYLWTLRRRGARIGRDVKIHRNVLLDRGCLSMLEIEDGAVISFGAQVVLHDSSMHNIFGLPVRYGKIILRRNSYIGAGSVVLPGVEIGENTLVGAGSLVTKSIPANKLAYGWPAKVICDIAEAKEKFLARMKENEPMFYYENGPLWKYPLRPEDQR